MANTENTNTENTNTENTNKGFLSTMGNQFTNVTGNLANTALGVAEKKIQNMGGKSRRSRRRSHRKKSKTHKRKHRKH
jgi:hypothetical protein